MDLFYQLLVIFLLRLRYKASSSVCSTAVILIEVLVDALPKGPFFGWKDSFRCESACQALVVFVLGTTLA